MYKLYLPDDEDKPEFNNEFQTIEQALNFAKELGYNSEDVWITNV